MIHYLICIVGVERKMRGLGSTHLLTGGWERIPMPRELVKTPSLMGGVAAKAHQSPYPLIKPVSSSPSGRNTFEKVLSRRPFSSSLRARSFASITLTPDLVRSPFHHGL